MITKDSLADLYASGKVSSMAGAARHFGVSRERIRQLTIRYNLESPGWRWGQESMYSVHSSAKQQSIVG